MNIHDIAARCGVSSATVSRVLNHSPKVSEKTRERVLTVMREEGYTPNAFARGLGLDSMKMVGILCTDVADLYYARAVSLVERSLRERGFDILLCCTGNTLAEKQRQLNRLLEKRVDALVLIGSAFREEQDNSHLKKAAAQVPVVIINAWISIPNVHCVLCDEREAMERNIRLLAAKGCRRILYLYDTLTYSGLEKLSGIREGLAACGLPEQKELFLKTPEKSIASARQAVKELLEGGILPDAVAASEDLLAVGAQKALKEAGICIPLIGFNNSTYGECTSPALTSVDNMLDMICPTAVQLLAKRLAGQEAPQKILFSSRLVERETFQTEESK